MNKMEWNDRQGHRDRQSWLLLVKGDKVIPFAGCAIPGVVVVAGSDYVKQGKWSCSTCRLALADGVRAIGGLDGWQTGRWTEGLGEATGKPPPDTWAAVADCLGVSVPAAQEFLRGWRPLAAKRLDRVEAEMSALADADADAAAASASAEGA